MSRNSILVAIGSLWTFGSTLSITELVVSTSDPSSLAFPLGIGMLLSALYWLACGVADAACLRLTANLFHVSVPVIWVTWMVSLHQTALTPDQAVFLVLNMALGAAVADLGSFGDWQADRRRAWFAEKREGYVMRPLSAYESGRFSVPRLSACDSGGFPRP